jgi:hypothetical protein
VPARRPHARTLRFEVKWDGIRLQTRVQDGHACVRSRPGRDCTAQFPELGPLGQELGSRSVLLDGELVCLGPDGGPDFAAIRRRLIGTPDERSRPVTLMVFDLLHLDGEAVWRRPYRKRRALLEDLLGDLLDGVARVVRPRRKRPGRGSDARLLSEALRHLNRDVSPLLTTRPEFGKGEGGVERHPGRSRLWHARPMRWILALPAIAVLAVSLAAASPASAKRCGAYAKSDGSLAESVVTNIAVIGMSCAAGQTVANGYHGLIGSFKAYGFACVALQGSPQSRGSVRCVKRRRRTTYKTALLTDCSMTPGINANSAFQWSGPWTYNTGCPEAVSVFNTTTTTPNASPGWTCSNTNLGGDSCVMRSGETFDVVQWAPHAIPS